MREIDEQIPSESGPIPPSTESPESVETMRSVETMHASSLQQIHNWTIHPVGFGIAVLAIAFVAYQLIGGLITYFLFGVDVAGNVQSMRAVTVLSQLLFLVGPAVALLYLQPWNAVEVFRLRAPALAPLLPVAISVLGAQFFGQVYLDVQQHVLRSYLLPDALLPLLDSFEKMISELYESLLVMRSPGEALFVLFVVGFTPAVCEEALFRGTVQYSFERVLRMRWVLLLTGAIFAMFHLNPLTFVPLTLLGAWLGFVVWRGGSIWYAVIGHALNNSLAVVSLYMLETDSFVPKLDPGAFPDAATVLLGVAGLAAFLLSVLWFWRLTARPRHDSPSSL
jgi:membrane protease YdiL (CAAX protease family)